MATMTADSPRRYRFTAEEYRQMGTAGVLRPGARVELIEGELIDMAPIGPAHAATVERLADLLRRAVAERAMVRTQQPCVVGEYSVPQPGITVAVRRHDYYERAHPEPRDVLLIVQVASTTLAFDRDVNASMYARSGVERALDRRRERALGHATAQSARQRLCRIDHGARPANRSRSGRFPMFASTCKRSCRAEPPAA